MQHLLPAWFEIAALSGALIILIFDLLLIVRRPHIPSLKEASLWVSFYVLLALSFALTLFFVGGPKPAGEFVAGWLTEYSLSIDNLFVFVLLLASFNVPHRYQQRALMVGILVALVFRGVFILLGAVVIERFIAVFYIFGAWLIWTAFQQIKDDADGDLKDGLLVKAVKKWLPYSDEYDGAKMFTRIDGKKLITPMLLVYLALGSTDLLFALDSIPAIFGITQDPFLVFMANVFALMGLRQLYFLLGNLLDKLEYLKYGISAILAFIGVKLVLHALNNNNLSFISGGEGVSWAPEIPIWFSLVFILTAIVLATVFSVIKMRRDQKSVGGKVRLGADAPTDKKIE